MYSNMLTPPLSVIDDTDCFIQVTPRFDASPSPSFYDISANRPGLKITGPHLSILEQPVGRFRFRYKSEMAGTHGSLTGEKSDRTRKQTYPTVQLRNYDGTAIIRCTLYQNNADDPTNMPHAHRLVKKVDQQEMDDPHDITVNFESKYIASFHSMGIIHTAKKNIVSELTKKKIGLKREEIARVDGQPRLLTKGEEVTIKALAEEESKNINLNIVCLKFEAFRVGVNEILYPICAPVFSNPINNLKSALTGELKIVRMDHCTSSCKGNKEIFILVEKVTKKNVKIRFYEEDAEGGEIWEDYGKFSDLDVHHQYAIVFKTPPYKTLDITRNVKVYIELVRPSDNSTSEPKEFTYIPLESVKVGVKRPRLPNDSTSSSFSGLSFRSSEIPTTISNMEVSSAPLDINSEDFRKVLKDLLPLYENESIEKDTPRGRGAKYGLQYSSPGGGLPGQMQRMVLSKGEMVPSVGRSNKREIDERFKTICHEACHQLVSLLRTKPSKEKVHKMLKLYFDIENKDYNPLHTAVHMGNVIIVTILLKIIKGCGEDHIINISNESKETPLHLAAEAGYKSIIQLLLDSGADTCVQDVNGCTALHVMVRNQAPVELLHVLLKCKPENVIDLENNDGDTALNVAIENCNLRAVEFLLAKGAFVNKVHKKNGFTPLRQAVSKQNDQLVDLILKSPDVEVMLPDFNGVTPLQFAKILVSGSGPIVSEAFVVCRLLEDYMRNKNLPIEDVLVKEEGESSEDEDMEVDTCPEIKSEIFNSEELSAAYEKMKEFTEIGLQKVCDILDKSGSWMDLAKLLDLECLHSTDFFESNPSRTLLLMAIANGDSLFHIRNFLDNLDESEAVKIMDSMVMSQ